MNTDLPFPRGETYFDGNADRIADTTYASVKHLLGHTFTVKNDGQSGVGVDSTETELMIVRNGTAGNITSGLSYRLGGNANEVTSLSAAGGFGYVADDAYAGNIATGDLYYAVVRGPVGITYAAGGSVSSMVDVTVAVNGKINITPSAGDHIYGRIHLDQGVAPGAKVIVNIGPVAGTGATLA